MKQHNYYVYIVTNKQKNVIYIGMTNDLSQRLSEHFLNRGNVKSFTGKYQCYFLVYYERHQQVMDAIAREKELKGWGRDKKKALISSFNQEWLFMNSEVVGKWPPEDMFSRG